MLDEAAVAPAVRRPPLDVQPRALDASAQLSLRRRVLLFAPALGAFTYSLWQTFLEPLSHPWIYRALVELSVMLIVACTLAASRRVPSVLLASVLLVAMGTRLSLGVIDDAYISLRYARNFAHGLGLVFNAGERVEGYTAFSWVWLLGTLHRVSRVFDLEAVSVALGIASSIVALAVTQRIARQLQSRDGSPADPGTILLLAMHYPLVFWSFSGMETGLCLALMCGGTYFICKFLSDERALRALGVASLLWVLAMMTRPEDYLLFAAHLPFVGWRRGWLRPLLVFCTPLVCVFLPYFAWRYDYYGYPFPNTYYAKVGTPFSQLEYGRQYLLTGLIPHALLIPFAVLGLLRRSTHPPTLYIATMAALIGASILITGADHFSEWRYFTYLLPFLYLLACPELSRALAIPAHVRTAWHWPLRSIALAACCGSFVASVFLFDGVGLRSTLWHGANEAKTWADLGRYLARTTPADAVIAAPVIGAIGYFSDRRLIDMVGLTDATIAHHPIHGTAGPKDHQRFDSEYLMGLKPDRIYLLSAAATEAEFLKSRELPAVDDLKRFFPNAEYRYELVSGAGHQYGLYVRLH